MNADIEFLRDLFLDEFLASQLQDILLTIREQVTSRRL
jgi:hypothetical protein